MSVGPVSDTSRRPAGTARLTELVEEEWPTEAALGLAEPIMRGNAQAFNLDLKPETAGCALALIICDGVRRTSRPPEASLFSAAARFSAAIMRHCRPSARLARHSCSPLARLLF
jgi:hypothetical protein